MEMGSRISGRAKSTCAIAREPAKLIVREVIFVRLQTQQRLAQVCLCFVNRLVSQANSKSEIVLA